MTPEEQKRANRLMVKIGIVLDDLLAYVDDPTGEKRAVLREKMRAMGMKQEEDRE